MRLSSAKSIRGRALSVFWLPSCADSRADQSGYTIPRVHPDEVFYPLYVLRVRECEESKDGYDAARPTLSASDFGKLSTVRAVAELQTLGVPLERPYAALHVVFSRGAEHHRLYKSDNPPSLDITQIELDDAICHIRIVGNCIHRFKVRRKKISRDLSLLHRRRRVGQSALNTEAIDRLFQRLYTTRRLLNEHTILLQQLRRKVKIRVKETKARLRRQVIVSPHVQPIQV